MKPLKHSGIIGNTSLIKKIKYGFLFVFLLFMLSQFTLTGEQKTTPLENYYNRESDTLKHLLQYIKKEISGLKNIEPQNREKMLALIHQCRLKLKSLDIWYRYLHPLNYRNLNAVLPVEWETEVYEKWKHPYKREGYGLYLAEQALQDESLTSSALDSLIDPAIRSVEAYLADSIAGQLSLPHNQLFAVRLHLLNLSSIYTTGYECPDTGRIVPELKFMIKETYRQITLCYDYLALKDHPYSKHFRDILNSYRDLANYSNQLGNSYASFNHLSFIKQVNDVYSTCAKAINSLNLKSHNLVDYSINNSQFSLTANDLFTAQNIWGIYAGLNTTDQTEILALGRHLFFDPILSVNNQRSCASCHKPGLYYTENSNRAALQLDSTKRLTRNTPSLLHVAKYHLLMQDGKFYTLPDQIASVITNPIEMGSNEKEVINKVLGVPAYKETLLKFSRKIPGSDKPGMLHISSAISAYLGTLGNLQSGFYQQFGTGNINPDIEKGFNLFMGKAQCGTCHFFPYFGGTRPPYTGVEFESIGTAADERNLMISPDSGRYLLFREDELMRSFRTPMLLNVARTAPYMHNGAYPTLEKLMDFYNKGGGKGHGFENEEQTLPEDSLRLSKTEISLIIRFLHSLTEEVPADTHPEPLPYSKSKSLKLRKSGGVY